MAAGLSPGLSLVDNLFRLRFLHLGLLQEAYNTTTSSISIRIGCLCTFADLLNQCGKATPHRLDIGTKFPTITALFRTHASVEALHLTSSNTVYTQHSLHTTYAFC